MGVNWFGIEIAGGKYQGKKLGESTAMNKMILAYADKGGDFKANGQKVVDKGRLDSELLTARAGTTWGSEFGGMTTAKANQIAGGIVRSAVDKSGNQLTMDQARVLMSDLIAAKRTDVDMADLAGKLRGTAYFTTPKDDPRIDILLANV